MPPRGAPCKTCGKCFWYERTYNYFCGYCAAKYPATRPTRERGEGRLHERVHAGATFADKAKRNTMHAPDLSSQAGDPDTGDPHCSEPAAASASEDAQQPTEDPSKGTSAPEKAHRPAQPTEEQLRKIWKVMHDTLGSEHPDTVAQRHKLDEAIHKRKSSQPIDQQITAALQRATSLEQTLLQDQAALQQAHAEMQRVQEELRAAQAKCNQSRESWAAAKAQADKLLSHQAAAPKSPTVDLTKEPTVQDLLAQLAKATGCEQHHLHEAIQTVSAGRRQAGDTPLDPQEPMQGIQPDEGSSTPKATGDAAHEAADRGAPSSPADPEPPQHKKLKPAPPHEAVVVVESQTQP